MSLGDCRRFQRLHSCVSIRRVASRQPSAGLHLFSLRSLSTPAWRHHKSSATAKDCHSRMFWRGIHDTLQDLALSSWWSYCSSKICSHCAYPPVRKSDECCKRTAFRTSRCQCHFSLWTQSSRIEATHPKSSRLLLGKGRVRVCRNASSDVDSSKLCIVSSCREGNVYESNSQGPSIWFCPLQLGLSVQTNWSQLRCGWINPLACRRSSSPS